MLTVQGLDFSFDSRSEQRLFESLSLQVEAGEHIVIVGDSGGGKSTLLDLIAEQNHLAINLDEGKSSVMVLQEGALLDHLNVIDNVRIVARHSDYEVSEKAVVSILSELGIQPHLHQVNVSQLSGGQMRRVAIARALICQPDLILFDEPDAGLDIVNLKRLGRTVRKLSNEHDKACITISHNPFYIAQIATKVYRLQHAKLELIENWQSLPEHEDELLKRQMSLQAALNETIDQPKTSTNKARIDPPFKLLISGLEQIARTVFHRPKSLRDELKISAYVFYLSMISGLVFFSLVGLMLGSTLIAVVRLLADNALNGIVAWFIEPEDLIEMVGGRYVVYLAPAIGGMLFASRSGSIVTNWLGAMVSGKQTRALRFLGINPDHYLAAPSVLSLFLSMLLTILWFTAAVWLGGVLATEHLFEVSDAFSIMSLSNFDITRSSFWLKSSIYSLLTALIIVSLAMAKKKTSHQVNVHTTKAIIYSTLSITFTELLLILT